MGSETSEHSHFHSSPDLDFTVPSALPSHAMEFTALSRQTFTSTFSMEKSGGILWFERKTHGVGIF